ncbi:Obg family GTPase CgtA [bacterium endosymbiont of Pedicinus badii]|uniref:Obg family GTPase CgtA n=1 Tax=bacterium endosymbiont of Pedicinus badii TaxID=1719126 RepID=UPI0009BA55F7|nr:GTPase ObgE [bacterium endosymbiont of Pedicinus badii]OQM34186.1 hypothetical protein AOQ89_02515 [bacterium endosymbiont of Pedicinus badii]
MKFLDEVLISIRSGNGGNGKISYKKKKKYPDGGNGGKGGDVWICCNASMNSLIKYKHKNILSSENGENGKKNNCTGRKGKDLFLDVPLGTKIFDFETKECIFDIMENKFSIKLLQGGRGGLGNYFFRSKKKTEIYKTFGKKGIKKKILLSFFIPVDIGIVGKTNSGKSSLFEKISSVKTKIDNYPYTTLYPKIGICFEKKRKIFSLLDTPGIEKNSSSGFGLGIKFVKHLERCKFLVYILDGSKEFSTWYKDFLTIRKEIRKSNKKVFYKKFIVVVNKIDTISKKKNIEKFVHSIKTKYFCKKVYFTSTRKNTGIQKIKFFLSNIIRKEKNSNSYKIEEEIKKSFFWN